MASTIPSDLPTRPHGNGSGPAPTGIVTRLLPEEEWPRLITAGIEPFATYGLPPRPESWRILVAEQDGSILGCSCLRTEVLNDWFLRPEARHSMTIGIKLWDATTALATELGLPNIHATILDPTTQKLARHLGLEEYPGRLFIWAPPLPPPDVVI